MRELLVEIEPLRPEIEPRAAVAVVLAAPIGVAALVVALGARIILAAAEQIENRARPPMEMGIDDAHDLNS